MMLHRIIIIIITRITYRYKHIHKCNLVKTRNYCHLHGCDQQLKKACNKNKTFCTIEETRAKLNGHKPCLKIMGKIKIQRCMYILTDLKHLYLALFLDISHCHFHYNFEISCRVLWLVIQ